jgi:hypothetical protein
MGHAAVKRFTAQARRLSDSWLPACAQPARAGPDLFSRRRSYSQARLPQDLGPSLVDRPACCRSIVSKRCRCRRSAVATAPFGVWVLCHAAAADGGLCAAPEGRFKMRNNHFISAYCLDSPEPCETRHSGLGEPSLNLASLPRPIRHAFRRASRPARRKREPADRRFALSSGRRPGSQTEWRDRWPW